MFPEHTICFSTLPWGHKNATNHSEPYQFRNWNVCPY
jgi:hypothetical protein